jgi:hypothetical protein
MVARSSLARYPASALRAAQRTFDLVTAEPTNLYLDGADFGDDLPADPIPLRELRSVLLRPVTSMRTRDAVWRELICRARRDRSTWVVVAVGMAMPGLRRAVRVLTRCFTGDPADLEAEVVRGFLEALTTIDVADAALCARLVRAGHKAGTRLVYAEAAFDGARWAAYQSRAPRPPWGHPDFLLLAAVATGVITDGEAKLIATTRLEGVPVDRVAALLGERTGTVVVRRHRAEHRLAAAIADGTVPGADTRAVVEAARRATRRDASSTNGSRGSVLDGVPTGGGNRGLTRRPFPDAGSPGTRG